MSPTRPSTDDLWGALPLHRSWLNPFLNPPVKATSRLCALLSRFGGGASGGYGAEPRDEPLGGLSKLRAHGFAKAAGDRCCRIPEDHALADRHGLAKLADMNVGPVLVTA